jgi:dTDP-4-dehydrorhamnose 3,5-epimerase
MPAAIERLDLPEVFVITSLVHPDPRGSFCETYRASILAEAGCEQPFVQENLARTQPRGVLRGLHFQREPFAQEKLVQVLAGAIFDVAVDIRPASPTLGRWVGLTLTAETPRQLFVPRGFAHGYLTLTENCVVQYKTGAYYAPAAEGGVAWNDPALAIDWPMAAGEIQTNPRDDAWPPLAQSLTSLP